jgi:hypothetical protein
MMVKCVSNRNNHYEGDKTSGPKNLTAHIVPMRGDTPEMIDEGTPVQYHMPECKHHKHQS